MALAVNQVTGRQDTVGGSSFTTNTFTSVSGSLIIVIGHGFDAVGQFGTALLAGDVTDNKGNTYSVGVENHGTNFGMGVWYNDGGTRGAGHTVTFNPTTNPGHTADFLTIGICEVTGHLTPSPFDATTKATAADVTSPYTVTAGSAITGNQIAIYGVTPGDTGSAGSYTDPTGYTPIFAIDGVNGCTGYSAYKINETGTPSPAASFTQADGSHGIEVFATFKEAAGGGGATGPVTNITVVTQQTIQSAQVR